MVSEKSKSVGEINVNISCVCLFKHHAMNVYEGEQDIAPRVINIRIGKGWVGFTSRPLNTLQQE